MPVGLTCPCGKRLQVSEEFAGRQGRCPACGALLQIPGPTDPVTPPDPSSDATMQALFTVLESHGPATPGAVKDAVTLTTKSPGELHGSERAEDGADDKGELTAVGCVLTLLTVVVIFGVAVPIVRWRDPETGQPLPRTLAILSPVLIGAVVHGVGALLLRLFGLRVWAKREADADG